MKKKLLFIITIGIANLAMAQNIVPAIFVVDGVLPKSAGFECITDTYDTLSFTYFRSHFQMNGYTYQKLESLSDTVSLKIIITYTEWYDGPPTKKMYEFECSMWKKVLMSGNILISVTTFDSDKTVYYVDYSGGGFVKVYEYDKRYGNRRKAFQKVHALYPKLHTHKKNVTIYRR